MNWPTTLGIVGIRIAGGWIDGLQRRGLLVGIASALLVCVMTMPRVAIGQDRYAGRSFDARTFVYFKVSGPALQKILPQGWEVDPITSGPAAQANLKVIFVDQMAALNAMGKPSNGVRNVLFQIPVKTPAGNKTMLLFTGLSPGGPGTYGTNIKAAVRVERKFGHNDSAAVIEESWDLQAPTGERVALRMKFTRGPVAVEETESRVYSQVRPDFFRVYRVEQAVDVVRTANESGRILDFKFEASGEKLSPLFDGSEQVISIESVPVYARRIFLPPSDVRR